MIERRTMWRGQRAAADRYGEPDAAKFFRLSQRELHELLTGDPEIAARWLRVAAEHGLPAAQVRFGRMLLEGRGVAQDAAAALGWFQTAARSHDAEAMNMVGRCFENGWGTAKDMSAAAHWFGKSAAAGHDWGQYNFGHMLLDGSGGLERDPAQALSWYLKAAGQGHARAMNLVARCHEEGWGTARDPAASFHWYRRSAEGGYFRGQYNYATSLLQQGEIARAADWFWRAAESGTPELRRIIAGRLLGSAIPALIAIGERVLALG
ncbi:MAG TPA: tetratricopeptide repeat protein [Aliidongia sp.]|nr:tetratricopeptide repeat protein [Aliidongia sp.]